MGASEEEALESAKTLVTTGEQLSTTSDETTMQFSVKASKYNGDSDSLALVQVETSSFFHGQVNTSCLSFNPAGFLLLSKCGDQKTQSVFSSLWDFEVPSDHHP